jgi:uncharacterized protein YegP (UPF0339 family)
MEVIVWLAADGWRWHAKARNGRIVAESGEAYTQRSRCIAATRKVFNLSIGGHVLLLPFDKNGERTQGEWLR